MDSRLAIDYGIISLPTMFLVDAQGKVVNRNLRIGELEKQLEKLLPAKEAGRRGPSPVNGASGRRLMPIPIFQSGR